MIFAVIAFALVWIALKPTPRFQPLGDDEDAALDTRTGKICLTFAAPPKSTDDLTRGDTDLVPRRNTPYSMPYCWEIK